MDDQQIRDDARRLLLALSRSGEADLQPLPAQGHVVRLQAWRGDDRGSGGEPLLTEVYLWDERQLQVLDEAGCRQYLDAEGRPGPGVFLHTFNMTPDWGHPQSEAGMDDESPDSDPDLDGAWMISHSFGGLFRGRPFFQGLQHWVRLDGDQVVVDDSDMWFA